MAKDLWGPLKEALGFHLSNSSTLTSIMAVHSSTPSWKAYFLSSLTFVLRELKEFVRFDTFTPQTKYLTYET